MTLIGAVMVLGSGAYLISLFAQGRKTYDDLQPEPDPDKDGPSGKVVFIVLAVLVISIGFMVLGLGVISLLRPAQTEESVVTPATLAHMQLSPAAHRT